MIGLGLEVEAFGKSIVWENSPLGSRVRVGQICRDYESEISGILLMVDLKVVDILGFDVILCASMCEFQGRNSVKGGRM